MPSQLGKFNLISTLGQGSYSKVKLAVSMEDGKYYAVKIHKDDPDFTEDKKTIIINEIQTLKALNHEHIV